MSQDDYTELPIYWEDLPEGARVDLWITLRDEEQSSIVLEDVKSASRWKGWWSIDYLMLHMRATALIPAQEVLMFSVVQHPPAP